MGAKGPPQPAAEGTHQPFGTWFASFLRDELRPYPGRMALVLRMTLAAALTMLAIMTFRLPGAAIAAYYTLLLSRESPVSTVRAAWVVLLMYILGAGYTLLSVLLFVDYPLTHFLWVAFSLFACFYVIKVSKNYVGAAAFAFIITIAIPIWDTSAPTAALVVATLWAAGSVSVGLICTIAVEYLFAGLETKDEWATGLRTRIDALSAYLRALSEDDPAAAARGQRVQQLAMVGVSRLRSLALQAGNSGGGPERRSTTVSLIGRAVDLAAALPQLLPSRSEEDKVALQQLAEGFQRLPAVLGLVPARAKPSAAVSTSPSSHPVLGELTRIVDLLNVGFTPEGMAASDQTQVSSPASSFLVADAFTNPDHLYFSLRGCLAAMLCYVILNAIAWRGLSTSIATCVITALTSIGSSRQKQVLRLTGAIVGGLVLGIGSQVLILPMLDSIAGFMTLFVAVTFFAGWISTSSPRLSYFGSQVALAFYLIHLQEYFPQTNLAIARDRVMGVTLGLLMMWLVFDTLGSKPAAQVMRDIFVSNLKLLSDFSRPPWKEGKPVDVQHFRQVRETLSSNFGSVNSQADAVLFEIGPFRERDLRLRERLLGWQPRLRALFLLETALLQYRAEIRPDQLDPQIVKAQVAFDEQVSGTLMDLAHALQHRRRVNSTQGLQQQYADLETAALHAYHDAPTARARGVLAIAANIVEVLDSLRSEFVDQTP